MAKRLTERKKLQLLQTSLYKGKSVTQICKDLQISRTVFYLWKKKLASNLNIKLTADSYQPAAKARQEIIFEYLRKQKSVCQICREYNLSRDTFYKWLRRWRLGEGFSDKTRKWSHFARQATDEQIFEVLELVKANPRLSSHKIVKFLPQVGGRPVLGNHGVQNVLKRFDLSTYGKRRDWVSIQQIIEVPPQIPTAIPVFNEKLKVLRFILSPFATVPKVAISNPYLWPITLPLFAFFAYIFQLDYFFRPAMFFPTIALTFGLIFFLYSLKYYFSLILILVFPNSQSVKENKEKKGFFSSLFKRLAPPQGSHVGLTSNLDKIKLEEKPFVSIHIPFYNEKNVAERILIAVTSMDWPNYEVVIADDSTDDTVRVCQKFAEKFPFVKLSHRDSRQGFKGGALSKALEKTDPRAKYILVFDADFVPYPDTIQQFLKYYQLEEERAKNAREESKVAVVQGYQWHILNKSENWVTRGVRTEYAGSYVIERAGIEYYGGLKMIAGSVFCIRRDILEKFGWGTSITEDFQLTLRLYEAGYKVIYTPYIQAPSECVSTVRRLIRQRMRWAEGHTFNVRRMWSKLFMSPNLTSREKMEFLYLGPYYLQAAFFLVGTFAWLISEIVLGVRLPFWTAVWGWGLVFANFFSLPLVNVVGLFLEESDEKDYLGIGSFLLLSYIVVPFQAYSAVKALFEKEEGNWFRTPKSGRITEVLARANLYNLFNNFKLWGKGALERPSIESGIAGVPLEVPTNISSFRPFFGYKVAGARVPFMARGAIGLLLVLVLIVNYLTFFTPGVKADTNGPGFEQQLNLVDQIVTPSGSTLNWAKSNDTSETFIYSLVYDSVNKVIYGGSGNNSNIYRSTNGGSTWTNYALVASSKITALTIDTTNKILYAGVSNNIIYRCDITVTACDAQTDWTVAKTGAQAFNALVFDSTTSAIYAGDNTGNIYRCLNSTASNDLCKTDNTTDWSSYKINASATIINALAFDSANNILYAGSAITNKGVIYRCPNATTGNCDAQGDWAASYTPSGTTESYYIDAIAVIGGIIYAGSDRSGLSDGLIYRCTNTSGTGNCNDSGDWTSYSLAASGTVLSFTFDSTRSVIYAGTTRLVSSTAHGTIYACKTSTDCDATTDWTDTNWAIAYDDTTETSFYSLAFDPDKGIVYAGSNPGGVIFSHNIFWGQNWGMVCIPTSNYDGTTITYTFEVLAKVTSVTGGAGTVTLSYNSGTCGSSVAAGSTVQITGISASATTYSLYSATFTASGSQYAFISDMTGTNISVKAARVDIVQNSGTVLTKSETQVEIGNAEPATTSLAYADLSYRKDYCYSSNGTGVTCSNTPTVWSPTPTAHFEATLAPDTTSVHVFEQELNIMDQQYQGTIGSATDNPTDNSLGLVNFNPTKYSVSNNVFFEAVIKATGSGDYTTATLYTSAGVAVSGSAVTTNSISYTRVRIATSLTNLASDYYTVRVKTDQGYGLPIIKAARLIVVQSENTTTATETQIEIGNNESGTNWIGSYLSNPKIWKFNASNFSPATGTTTTARVAITAKSDSVNGDVIYDLNDLTTGSTVSDAAVDGNSWTYGETSIYANLIDGHEYGLVISESGGSNWFLANAKIILDQSGTVTAFETPKLMVNTLATSTGAYASQNFLQDLLPADWRGGIFDYVFESTIKVNSGTGTAQMTAAGSAVSGSEVAASSSNYLRKTSGSLKSLLYPFCVLTSDTALDTQIYNSGTGTTSVAGSWLLIKVSNLAEGSGICAELYNVTAGAVVSGSRVEYKPSANGTSYTLAQSDSISLTAGNDYVVKVRYHAPAGAGYLANAKIVLDQSSNNGISALETVQMYNNTYVSLTGITPTPLNYNNQYRPGNFTGTNSSRAYYLESDIYFWLASKGNNTTANADLIKNADAIPTPIPTGIVATITIVPTRSRSADVSSAMPAANSSLDVRLYTSPGTTTGDSSKTNKSWFIIQITALPVPEKALLMLPFVLFFPYLIRRLKKGSSSKIAGFRIFRIQNKAIYLQMKKRRRKHRGP